MSEDLKADVMRAAQRANKLKNINTQNCQPQGKSLDQGKKFGNPQIIQESGNILETIK